MAFLGRGEIVDTMVYDSLLGSMKVSRSGYSMIDIAYGHCHCRQHKSNHSTHDLNSVTEFMRHYLVVLEIHTRAICPAT